MPALTIKDVGDVYGSLNELSRNPGPSADRRITTTTEALSAALASIYTPDALAGKTTFLGIVLISYPTKLPRQGSKQELLHSPREVDGDNVETRLYPYYDVYKVYIPELEPIPLIWNNTKPGPYEMTLQQRVMTFDDIIPGKELLREMPGPIAAGTIVAIEYEDLSQLKNPRIVGISGEGPAFSINLSTGKSGLINAFNRKRPNVGLADMPWYDRQLQATATWHSTDARYEAFNDTVLKNGEIHETPGLMLEDKVNGKVRNQLLTPAYRDWKLLQSAYTAKFPDKVLNGGGYRPYKAQVSVRMQRVGGDENCQNDPRCFKYSSSTSKLGSGISNCNEKCGNIGVAAVPGTSPHGWGAAVDMDGQNGWAFPCRTGYSPTAEQTAAGIKCDDPGAVLHPRWLWLNMYAVRHNFKFNVDGEHWHLGWLSIASVTDGKVTATQSRWDDTEDASILYGPGPTPQALARWGSTADEEAAANEASNTANETAEADAAAAAKAAEEKAAADKATADKAAQMAEERAVGEAMCTPAAFLNEDGTAGDNLDAKIAICERNHFNTCRTWLAGRLAYEQDLTGPTLPSGQTLDCTTQFRPSGS